MIDYFVREIVLPLSVEGVTLPNADGSFDIYINSLLSPSRRSEVLEHELNHISRDHFYLEMPITLMERQADGEAVNIVLHPPAGMLPVFRSEYAMLEWLRLISAQQHLDLQI